MSAKELVLVIGGTRGAGLLAVRRLRREGYRVRILARDPATAGKALGPDVDIVKGDLTCSSTLRPALRGVDHVIFTAGVHSGRMAPESLVKATDYQGTLDTMEAARIEGLKGRFVYLNSIGITGNLSWAAKLLNFLKRNTLYWRFLLETEIRRSGLDYTIIRVGFLTNNAGGERQIKVSQQDLPLVPANKICREDVAEAFVEAMRHPQTSRTTFGIVWDKGPRHMSLNALYAQLQPDKQNLSASGALGQG